MSEKICRGDHKGHLCVLASNELFDQIPNISALTADEWPIARIIFVIPCRLTDSDSVLCKIKNPPVLDLKSVNLYNR
jgi:hypothetical protein